jgi:hypothetical protein
MRSPENVKRTFPLFAQTGAKTDDLDIQVVRWWTLASHLMFVSGDAKLT